MASQFFGLNIAYTGLLASNAALNTTSNNIANVQTEGYSRQQVIQQASTPIRVFEQYGCAGAGVDTLAVERIRDGFYDAKFWANNSRVGEYDMKQYYMQQVETYLNDDGTNAGFKTVFDNMMLVSLEELMKNPGDTTTKSQFVGSAGALAEYFNGLAGNMESLQKDLNSEVKVKVDEINSLADEIATLNNQINIIELSHVSANELRDRRDMLLNDLSKIVNIDISETPIVDTNNQSRETGANRFMVKIAGGQVLVDGSDFNGLECRSRALYEKVQQTDIDGLYDVYWEDGTQFNLHNAAMGGELQGLVHLRDGNNGEFFHGEVVGVGTDQATQKDTVTINVTDGYLKDLNKANLSDKGGIISLGNRQFYYDSWDYEVSFDANKVPTYSYTFTLSSEPLNKDHVTNDRVGMDATIGSAVDFQGIPYYMNQVNEWLRTFSMKFNDILLNGFNSYNTEGVKMFTGKHATDGEQFQLEEQFRYDHFIEKEEANTSIKVNLRDDSYYHLTAKNVSILKAVESDPDMLANKYKQGDGVEQSDLLHDLRTMATNKSKMSFRGSSASEFLQNVLSDVALNASRSNKFYQSFKEIGNSIDNQRISISGVDEDEEAVNLVKYQNGYNLAAKMIQTLTEIYDRLITQTGV